MSLSIASDRKRQRRWPWFVAAGIGVAALGAYLAIARPFAAEDVTVAIERRTLRDEVDVSGTVESRFAVTLKAEAAGPVTVLHVTEGTRVPGGKPLTGIDPDTARLQLAQARSNAAAGLSQATTELANAERALAQAQERHRLLVQGLQNDLDRASSSLSRTEQDARTSQRLLAEGAVSRQSADQLQTQLEQARIALRTAQDALTRTRLDQTEIIAAKARLAAAETALANARKQGKANVDLAEAAWRKTVLRAPFTGTITQWLVRKGDYVGPGTPLATFQDLSDVVLKLPVDETDMPKMKVGGPVSITFDAYPERTFQGEILTIGKASTRVKEVMVFPVEVRFDDPERLIKPGMSGDAEVLLEERRDVVAVPLAAVKRDKGRYFVEVRDKGDDKPREITFQPGIITLEHVEALSGLEPGLQVLIPADRAAEAR